MDLEKMICDEVKNQINSTEFKENMQAEVKKMLDNIIRNLLSWEIKEAIEKPLKDSMLEAIGNVSISNYIPKIDYLLTSVIRESSVGHYRRITKNFKQLLTEETPESMKVSELFKEYTEYCANWVNTSDLEIITDGDRAYYEDLNCKFLVKKNDNLFGNSRLILQFSCDEDTELNKEILLQKDYRGEYRLPFANYDLKSLRYLSPFEILFLRLAEKQTKIEVDIYDAEDCIEVNDEPEAYYE
ncbi:MAG: hypothetical protein ACLT5F_09755 [Anaerotignaceae bacterium]|nr:hypothetical protein [Eubacterium sp.]